MQQVNVENRIVESLKEKQPTAFESFYNQYAPAFYGDIKRILNQHKIADVILAEAFVTIWDNIEKYDSSKERLFTWSLKLVRKEACEKKMDLVLKELFACQQMQNQ